MSRSLIIKLFPAVAVSGTLTGAASAFEAVFRESGELSEDEVKGSALQTTQRAKRGVAVRVAIPLPGPAVGLTAARLAPLAKAPRA